MRIRLGLTVATVLSLFCIMPAPGQTRDKPFMIGADISWIPEDEAAGAQYFDNGVQKDIFGVLKDYQFNYVRLRVFVNPRAPRGYAARGTEAWCDIPHTLAMAKRAKAAGMGLLVGSHYSDNWADPEGQNKPSEWAGYTVEQLAQAVHDHTKALVSALKDQGTTPDIVQIGNEVTHGMLWPQGRVWSEIPSGNPQTDAAVAQLGPGMGNYDNFATFLKAGISAVREVDPNIKIMLHNHLGRHTARVVEWLTELEKRGVEFDVIGLSCYAQGQEGDWQKTFNTLAKDFPKYGIIVAEYSARKRFVNDLVFNTPDNKGLGTFIWEPTRHREALFNKNGVNAGGGQAYDFVADMGIDQGARGAGGRGGRGGDIAGATTRPGRSGLAGATTQPGGEPAGATTQPGAGFGRGGRGRGGIAGATTQPGGGLSQGGRGRGNRNGGRYDTNEWIKLYPQMAIDYGNKPKGD